MKSILERLKIESETKEKVPWRQARDEGEVEEEREDRSCCPRFYADNIMKNPLLQAVAALVANSSLGVKVLSASVLLSYCLSYSESAILALSVTPGYFWPPHFWIWTAFTHCFLEIHWWEVVVDIGTIVLVKLKSMTESGMMTTFFGFRSENFWNRSGAASR